MLENNKQRINVLECLFSLKKNPSNINFSPNNLEIRIRQIRETMQCTTQKDTPKKCLF